MATPSPKPEPKPARRVSATITIQVNDIEQGKAMELENAVRDLVEGSGARVFANYGEPFNGFVSG